AEEQQDCRDQRAGVADADPPDEVDDRKAPADRDVDAPDPRALDEQPRDREEEHRHDAERDDETDEPAGAKPRPQHGGSDLVSDRAERLALTDDLGSPPCDAGRRCVGVRFHGGMTISHRQLALTSDRASSCWSRTNPSWGPSAALGGLLSPD